jgi:hypothetical protein
LIGAIHEQGPAASFPPGVPLDDSRVDGAERPHRFELEMPGHRFGFEMPGPRASAVAVMATLAFGVVVGSIAGGTSVTTLASAPLIVVGLSPSNSTPSAATNQVVTLTDGEPSDVGGARASTAAAAASPAPADASASPNTAPTDTTAPDTSPPSAGFGGLPPVKHVFLIVLSDRGFTQSFGGKGGYLSGALRRQGELVQNYYAVAGAPLANEIALISGQGPTAQTAADCPVFARVSPGRKGHRGQVLGSGCVYPVATKTLADELTTAGHTWKAYIAGTGSGARTVCRVPKLGSRERQLARGRTSYLAWRNPFLYFRSLTAGSACRQNEVALGQLAKDVGSPSTAPSFAYIAPPPCADGGEAPCKPGAPAGLVAANRFLKAVVAEIKHSAAYKDGGLIAITFDQAPQTGPNADPSACCGPSAYPNLRRLTTPPATPPAAMGVSTSTSTTATGTTTSTTTPTTTPATTTGSPTTTATTGTDTSTGTTTPARSLGVGETTPTGGGGQVGLLLISRYVKPDSIDVVDYFNHFSLLATIENLFGIHHLGYAGIPGLPVFGLGVFNAFSG